MSTANQETTPQGGVVEASFVNSADPNIGLIRTATPTEQDGGDGRWIIYSLQERASGRTYVGVTCRPLQVRIGSHLSQARRGGRLRRGGLLEVLRDACLTTKDFHDRFVARVLGTATSRAEARTQEASWIARLRCMVPSGFNLMPGGSSLGGPSNARPVSVEVGGQRHTYASVGAALSDRNRSAADRGEVRVQRSTAHARLAAGWSPAEALGYAPHRDGRGARERFSVDGIVYSTLREASVASGLAIATLRSRLHRSKRRAMQSDVPEVGRDQRTASLGRRPLLGLVHPTTGEPVSARAYARATGLPLSTVLHRAHRLGLGASPEDMATPVERRRVVTCVGADGATVTGGYREVARRVLDPGWTRAPDTRKLSASAIRARLRRLTEVERSAPWFVKWACGQCPGDPSYEDAVALNRRRAQRHKARSGQDRAPLLPRG